MPTPTHRAYTRETSRLDASEVERFYPEPIYDPPPAEPERERTSIMVLIAVGAAVAWALMHSPSNTAPGYVGPPAAPSYVIQDSYNDSSVHLCVGFCPAAR